jgi:predicted PurR-regulated permease PerM
MSRMVSFIVLLAIVLALAGVFVAVMAEFVLPMFLALLLVVVFRPVHEWVKRRCGRREGVAAAITTLAIALVVLTPALFVLTRAAMDGVAVAREISTADIQKFEARLGQWTTELRETAQKVGIEVPPNRELQRTAAAALRDRLAPAALRTTQFLGSLLIGLFIMLLALYFFLLDGPAMVRTLMRLSPLDDAYEQQLVEEFGKVSRAVVLATLLSALAQGLLAGLGYLLTGIQAVFLLTMLSALFALVPFVGATIIWVPCCLFLYFYEGRPGAAIFLAIWCLAVVSMVDNLVKPWVLRGQSNIHPLLALLSVLGGASLLGPIGILVGPMIVAFLQAMLNILHKELAAMDAMKSQAAGITSQTIASGGSPPKA